MSRYKIVLLGFVVVVVVVFSVVFPPKFVLFLCLFRFVLGSFLSGNFNIGRQISSLRNSFFMLLLLLLLLPFVCVLRGGGGGGAAG